MMKPPSPELTSRIEMYAKRHKGKLYAPVPHPAFSHVPYLHGPERFDLIAPHLGYENGTVLDIGSNFGYIAHRLEDLGYRVTAVEQSNSIFSYLKEIRDLCERRFEVVHDSVFNLKDTEFDIVIALNILHHPMKTREGFEQLEEFLGRLKCRMMIYQAHDPSEPQMAGAYRNMTPEEATRFLSDKLSLPRVVEIGSYRPTRKSVRRLLPRLFTGPKYTATRHNLPISLPRALMTRLYRKNRRIFKLTEAGPA